MFRVEFRKNNKPFKNLAFADKISIFDALKDENLSKFEAISFKINRLKYVTGSYLLDSDCIIDIIGTDTIEGSRIYQDTAIFILMKAFYNKFPENSRLIVEHSIGDGVYCEVFGQFELTPEIVKTLKEEMKLTIARDLPIEKEVLEEREAEDIFRDLHRKDLIEYFKNIPKGCKIHVYRSGRFFDQYIRPLADRTSYIPEFDLISYKNGLILRFPKRGKTKLSSELIIPKKLFALHQEHDKWLNILGVHNVSKLNKIILDGNIQNMILVEEALKEKKIAYIVDKIKEKGDVKLILIAGPSSSGKTTFAKRLSIQLTVAGLIPLVIGMDDYFLPRTKTPKKENGDFDFENIKAIDLELLNSDLKKLLSGEEIEPPKYNFIKGIQERSYHKLRLREKNVVVMEGIHGLNEDLTSKIPEENKFRIYVSALNQLNLDDHNRIPTTDNRLIRRIIRDMNFRGYSAEETLNRWSDVRDGEEKYIFPYQENADEMFNSGHTYELAVLKIKALKFLRAVSKYSPLYLEAQRLILMLEHFESIEEGMVPKNSIIREFIGGSAFNY